MSKHKPLKQNKMTLFKTILAGLLAGALLFMMPFLIIKIIIFFVIIKAIFHLLGGRRKYGYATHGGHGCCGYEKENTTETKETTTT